MSALPIPRQLEFREKSGTPVDGRDYERKLLEFKEAAFQQAVTELRSNLEYDRIPDYIRALSGEFWSRSRPKYRSNYVDNLLAGSRIESLALLTDIRPTIDVTCHIDEFKDHGRIANDVIHDQWFRHDWDLDLIDVVDHAMFGVGYVKTAAVAAHGLHFPRLMFTGHGMDEVLPIHCNKDIQRASMVLFRQMQSLQYFRNKWGRRADGLEHEATSTLVGSHTSGGIPGGVDEYTWNSFSPAMQRLMRDRIVRSRDSRAIAFPTAELQEYWVDDPELADRDLLIKDPYLELTEHNYWYRVKKGERKWPRKRLIVFGGERPFYDGPSPFWHGFYPFSRLRLIPIVWGPGGLSKYRALMPINQAVNEIGAGTIDNIRKALNQTVVTKRGAVTDAAWRMFLPDREGGKLMLNPNAEPSAIRYVDPPVLPSYVFQALTQYLLPRFQNLAGTLDTAQLSKKKQLPGAEAIEQMRDLQAPHFRLESRAIERLLKDVGIQHASNVFQFFKTEDRLKMLGAKGLDWADFDARPGSLIPASMWDKRQHFWRMFSIESKQGSMHASARDREKQVAMTLFKMAAIDRQALLETMEIPNAKQILERMAAAQKEGMMQQSQGRSPRSAGQKKGAAV